MRNFEEKKFNIPNLKGISEKNIEEHLKLYAGYVKHSNLILEKIEELGVDTEKNAYALGEVQRRFLLSSMVSEITKSILTVYLMVQKIWKMKVN